ncbi:MAG: flagellar motor protein MotA [Rhodobacteraceae bacterium]|nr:flagellar motor protein MotA [Paracoccaceae bacterium]
MNDNKMATDLNIDQIKYSDVFDLKLSKRRPDSTLIIGLSAAVCLIVTALVLTGTLSAFYNIPAILLVFLGTLAVTMISYKSTDLARTLSECIELLAPKSANNSDACENILHLARYSKENGILALEKINNSISGDMFLRRAISLIIEGTNAEALEKILTQEMHEISQSRRTSVEVLRRLAEVAPSMGLIGTLIGLIQLLGNLNSPAEIGPAMAIALLTTFYGAVLAYMVFAPLAAKLEINIAAENTINQTYRRGAISITKQEHPHTLAMYFHNSSSRY